jgi:hypothetical protein
MIRLVHHRGAAQHRRCAVALDERFALEYKNVEVVGERRDCERAHHCPRTASGLWSVGR